MTKAWNLVSSSSPLTDKEMFNQLVKQVKKKHPSQSELGLVVARLLEIAPKGTTTHESLAKELKVAHCYVSAGKSLLDKASPEVITLVLKGKVNVETAALYARNTSQDEQKADPALIKAARTRTIAGVAPKDWQKEIYHFGQALNKFYNQWHADTVAMLEKKDFDAKDMRIFLTLIEDASKRLTDVKDKAGNIPLLPVPGTGTPFRREELDKYLSQEQRKTA